MGANLVDKIMATVSAAEYAKLRNVTRQAVSKAIAEGKLPTAAVKKGSRVLIDVEAADREWVENTNPAMGAPHHSTPKGHNLPDELKPIGFNIEVGGDALRPIGTESLAVSKAKREAFMAELARLEYEQKAGTLVPIEDVKKEAFKTARIVRDSILNIADRLAAELAAEPNQFRVHTRLTEELRKALEELGHD